MAKRSPDEAIRICGILESAISQEAQLGLLQAFFPRECTDSRLKCKPGTKAHTVGLLLLREEGVTREEACQETGWRSIHLPNHAQKCGLDYTKRLVDGRIRYYGHFPTPILQAAE
jgi:hypothetical protein